MVVVPRVKQIVVQVKMHEEGENSMVHITMERLQQLRDAELGIISDKVLFISREDRELQQALDKLCIDALPEAFTIPKL